MSKCENEALSNLKLANLHTFPEQIRTLDKAGSNIITSFC